MWALCDLDSSEQTSEQLTSNSSHRTSNLDPLLEPTLYPNTCSETLVLYMLLAAYVWILCVVFDFIRACL